MTDTPSLPAQIAALRRAIETRDHQSEQFELARYDAEALRAILVTLQQHERIREERDAETFRAKSSDEALHAVMREHERAMRAVEAARRLVESNAPQEWANLYHALAALDAAETQTVMTTPSLDDVVQQHERAKAEIEWLRRLLRWCRPRLKHTSYQTWLDMYLALGASPAPADQPPIVQSAALDAAETEAGAGGG